MIVQALKEIRRSQVLHVVAGLLHRLQCTADRRMVGTGADGAQPGPTTGLRGPQQAGGMQRVVQARPVSLRGLRENLAYGLHATFFFGNQALNSAPRKFERDRPLFY